MGYEKRPDMGLCDYGYCDVEEEGGVLGAVPMTRRLRRFPRLRRRTRPAASTGTTSSITVNVAMPPGAAVWPAQGVPWVAFDYRPPGGSWRQQSGGPVGPDGTMVITNPFPYGDYRIYATGWCGSTKIEGPKVSARIATPNPVFNVRAPVC
jgi:hypothetical protein